MVERVLGSSGHGESVVRDDDDDDADEEELETMRGRTQGDWKADLNRAGYATPA